MQAPEFEGVKNWDKEAVCLQPIQVEAWGPWIFVNLDPKAEPMSDVYGAIHSEIKFSHWCMNSCARIRLCQPIDAARL